MIFWHIWPYSCQKTCWLTKTKAPATLLHGWWWDRVAHVALPSQRDLALICKLRLIRWWNVMDGDGVSICFITSTYGIPMVMVLSVRAKLCLLTCKWTTPFVALCTCSEAKKTPRLQRPRSHCTSHSLLFLAWIFAEGLETQGLAAHMSSKLKTGMSHMPTGSNEPDDQAKAASVSQKCRWLSQCGEDKHREAISIEARPLFSGSTKRTPNQDSQKKST